MKRHLKVMKWIILVTLLGIVAGCTTTDNVDGENKALLANKSCQTLYSMSEGTNSSIMAPPQRCFEYFVSACLIDKSRGANPRLQKVWGSAENYCRMHWNDRMKLFGK